MSPELSARYRRVTLGEGSPTRVVGDLPEAGAFGLLTIGLDASGYGYEVAARDFAGSPFSRVSTAGARRTSDEAMRP